jgi:hypothetical protein
MLTTELKFDIGLTQSELLTPHGTLIVLIVREETKKLVAELVTLSHQEQQIKVAAFQESLANLDIMRYLATQPDKGLKIIQEWDALLVEAGVADAD